MSFLKNEWNCESWRKRNDGKLINFLLAFLRRIFLLAFLPNGYCENQCSILCSQSRTRRRNLIAYCILRRFPIWTPLFTVTEVYLTRKELELVVVLEHWTPFFSTNKIWIPGEILHSLLQEACVSQIHSIWSPLPKAIDCLALHRDFLFCTCCLPFRVIVSSCMPFHNRESIYLLSCLFFHSICVSESHVPCIGYAMEFGCIFFLYLLRVMKTDENAIPCPNNNIPWLPENTHSISRILFTINDRHGLWDSTTLGFCKSVLFVEGSGVDMSWPKLLSSSTAASSVFLT